MSDEIEEFLAHFGVKGMRWGVRKARKTVDKLKEPSQRQFMLEGKYIQKGDSAQEAKRKAENRLKTEKILAITGGIAIASLGAYVAKQEIGKRYTQVLLKEGTELKYINALGNKADFNRRLYTSFNEKDTQKYRGLLAKQLRANAPNTKIYETILKAKTDIKAPSHNQAKKIFNELDKTTFKTGLSYKKFNQLLVEDLGESKAFYQELTKRGYNAVLDSNDQFLSGYRAKKPLILFNAASSTVKAGQSFVDEAVTNKLYKKQMAGILAKSFAPHAAMGAAFVGTKIHLDNKSKYAVVNKHLANNPQINETPAQVFSKVKVNKKGNYYVAR